jgi:two-component system alkaline phosphatase synthesis response regulator PhoP
VVGDLEIDPGRREVRLAGKSVSLKRREFDLLHYLARHAGMTLSRSRLLDAVWADQLPGRGDTRTVDVHIHRLRERLEARPAAPRYLHTVRGLGYALRPAEPAAGAAR